MKLSPLDLALIVGSLALLTVGGLLTFRLNAGGASGASVPGVAEISEASPLPAFQLEGPQGPFGVTQLQGRWSFVFFGFTQCPDACPTALALMQDVKRRVAEKLGAGGTAPFQVIFVSVDPRRDTRELLTQYMAAFDPEFIGLRGEDAALLPLQRSLGVFFQRNDATDKQFYTVDHSTGLYLIDPQGRLAAVFSSPQEAEKVTQVFLRLRNTRDKT